MRPRRTATAGAPATLGVILFVVSVAGPATAATEGSAQAASASTDGISLLSGQLLALLQETQGGPLPAPEFRLSATSIVVETTTRDPTVHAGGVDAGVDPTTQSRELRDATLSGLRVRPDNRLDVFALPQRAAPMLQAQTGCSDWSEAGPDDVKREPRIPTYAERTVHAQVGEGARVTDCDGSQTWTVTGEFVVLLWQRDVEVQSAQGREELHSGRLAPQSAAGGADALPSSRMRVRVGPQEQAASRDQEIYLYVANGTLEMLMDSTSVAWVRAGATVSGVPALMLNDVTLRLGSSAPVQAAALRLEGEMDATFRTVRGHLDVTIAGEMASRGFAPIQDHSGPLPAPVASSWNPGVVAALSILTAAGSLLAGAFALGRQRSARPTA